MREATAKRLLESLDQRPYQTYPLRLHLWAAALMLGSMGLGLLLAILGN